MPRNVSPSRMPSPPSGIGKSVGVTILIRSMLPSMTPVNSTVSCMHFNAVQAPQ